MSAQVYFDHHSTTPVDPEVFQVMSLVLQTFYGNPSSRSHETGWMASTYVEKARDQIAQAIGADRGEVFFTSGATESNNWALAGSMRAHLAKEKKHFIITGVEHRSVRDTAIDLERWGFELTILPVKPTGQVDLSVLESAIQPNTVLISTIYGNNEIGTINPIAEIGHLCRSRKILFHTDATQVIGRLPIQVHQDQIDLMSMSAHKVYGPKGVGALFVRRGGRVFPFEPILLGGSQENGMRAGTLNVPGIVGFGKAVELAAARLESDSKIVRSLRDHLWARIKSEISNCHRNGDIENSLPHNLSITIEGVPAEPLMMQMKGFAFSAGAACSSAEVEPSNVLLSIGLIPEMAKSTIRIGLGRTNTTEEVDRFVTELKESVAQIRQLQKNGEFYGKPSSIN